MTVPDSIHVPVMLAEVLDGLSPQPGGVFVDGTLGGGGHTRALASASGQAERSFPSIAIQRPSMPLARILPICL